MGCRLNIVESEAIRELASGDDRLIVINSCAVTAEAVRQTRQKIRKAKRARPDARIIVTGCAAQTEPESFAAMSEVDRVIGNSEKMVADSYHFPLTDSQQPEAQVRVADIMAVTATAPHMVSAFSDHSRAFVEVQNGCDHRCTFCIIPYGRGNSRSVPAGAVIDRIKSLVDNGYQEIVLTGVDVTSYGADLPGKPTLGLLLSRILKHVPDLPRLRLSSLDSVEIDEQMFELVTSERRLMPHLHMSLQAGDDMILKRMKRRHNRAQALEIIQKMKALRPEIAIGADIIAGFPTETDSMFANSLQMIEECSIVYGHIFPYSPRSGTPAALMPQVKPEIRKERANILRAASDAQRQSWFQSLIGSRQSVLVEKGGTGHTENFAQVAIPTDAKRGSLQNMIITGTDGQILYGAITE
jgi:threonylcarbamoyladenosine tRNA methylthiotransferase MtaB